MKKNRIPVMILFIGIITTIIGFSYAFFMYGKTGLYTHTINGGKIGVIYNEITGNNITIDNAYPLTDSEALTRSLEFEFTITGYNESDKNVYYQIEMDHGVDVTGKNRFLDSDMKLTLYENDELVYKNEIFNNLDNQAIHYGYINYGTSSANPITNTYLLKIWINDNVFITSTPDYFNTEGKKIYSTSDFANSYANFKVNVIADLTYDEIGYLTYDANGGEFTPEKTSLTTGKVTTQKPVMDGKGFLGWSGEKNGEVEFNAGDVYTKDYDILYAVYGDTKNVMGIFPENLWNYPSSGLNKISSYVPDYSDYIKITNIYFINDTQESIDARYNLSKVKADITYNNQGCVKAWLEIIDEVKMTYSLYVGADGTIYFSDCVSLFYPFVWCEYIDLQNADSSDINDMTAMFSITGTMIGEQIANKSNDARFELLDSESEPFASEKIEIANLETLNTSNVTLMTLMFANSLVNKLNLEFWDTSNVINMFGMFDWCHNLTSLDLSSFNTSNVINMRNMFEGCSNLNYLNIKSFDTSQLESMSYMFANCESLKKLDLSHFETGNVTSMWHVFWDSSSLESIDVSGFDTKNVVEMYGMFSGCKNLYSLDLSNFDTSNVKNMASMFMECESLIELKVNNFNTSNVTDMSSMFESCINLTELSIENFDTSNVIKMSYMFDRCDNLVELDLSNFDTSKVTNMASMFFDCDKLTTIYVNSDWNLGNVITSNSMFSNCHRLVGAISYTTSKTDITAANPDTGYFTRKMHR